MVIKKKRKIMNRPRKKKQCPLAAAGIRDVDYKDVDLLRQFVTDRGKILPRRISGISARSQRLVSHAIRRARYMALLPFAAAE